jgi:pilus assembly protein CpaC
MKPIPAALITFLIAAIGHLSIVPEACAGAQVVGPATSQFALEIGKGSLIRFDGPAASVFIADPKVADVEVKSPTLVYVVGKAPGQTTLFAVDEHDHVLANVSVAVHYNETQLRQDLKRLLPNSNIAISTTNNALVLSGTVGSAAEGESAKSIAARFVPDQDHILNTMMVDAPNQVNLRVRICEVSRDVVKAFGFNWGAAGTPGHFRFGLATGNALTTTGASGMTQLLTRQNGVDNLLAGFTAGNVSFDVLIDALDNEGLVTVLAEPNLTAISGVQASFLAGGEFPIPVPQGLNVTTIDFKKFGVSLAFVATITDGGRINLAVKPEVSELSSVGAVELNGVTVPSLTTRRTETTVDLASGQSFAIAGLLQNNVTQNIKKFPGLGNVPVLGALFRSDKFERNESELVIIVTPYIVRPVSDKRLIAPTDGYVAPTDAQRFVNGADYQPSPMPRQDVARADLPPPRPSPGTPAGRGLIGPVGFDVQ